VFLPKLSEEGIDTVVHMGDLFDQRRNINIAVVKEVKERVLVPLRQMGIKMYWIMGNHDVYYKDTNRVNSAKVTEEFDNIVHIVDEPLDVDGMLLVPWISRDNHSACMDALDQTQSGIVMGHFEINGFEMTRGHKAEHGLSQTLFKNFAQVFSGHFHLPGQQGNVRYLGAPYQMDWNDCGGARGFHIFDTDTLDIEFVQNPKDLFMLCQYDESEVDTMDYDQFSEKFVRVIVSDSKDKSALDTFRESVENAGAYDLTLVDRTTAMDMPVLDDVENTEDTLSIIKKSVDAVQEKARVPGLYDLISDLYKEANAL
jgi:DNA repair exonuclease SbcCD nuclease subunit